jgi:hypothetical protein
MVDISRRLRDALVADLVADEDDPAEVDRLTRARIKDADEVRRHLGRQLGFWYIDGSGDIHATLQTLVPELERMLSAWPLPEDGRQAANLAQLACKDLNDYEVYATLLAGPSRWRKLAVNCTVDDLPDRLKVVLLSGFTASLNELLARWTSWDVPKLYGKWRDAKVEREHVEMEARRAATAQLSPEERQRIRADKAKVYGGIYTPPGKTV